MKNIICTAIGIVLGIFIGFYINIKRNKAHYDLGVVDTKLKSVIPLKNEMLLIKEQRDSLKNELSNCDFMLKITESSID